MRRIPALVTCLLAASPAAAAETLALNLAGTVIDVTGTPSNSALAFVEPGQTLSLAVHVLEPAAVPQPFAAEYGIDTFRTSIGGEGFANLYVDHDGTFSPLRIENDRPSDGADRIHFAAEMLISTGGGQWAPGHDLLVDAVGPSTWFTSTDLRQHVGMGLYFTYLDSASITLSDAAGTFVISAELESIDVQEHPDITFVGTYCVGDGVTDTGLGTQPCPCGNDSTPGALEGCRNSQGHGATLSTIGTTVYAANDLYFQVDGARPNQPSVLIEGTARLRTPWKDGLLCVTDATWRAQRLTFDATGSVTTAPVVESSSAAGPGVHRFYQVWYRDPAISVCGSGSNFTPAVGVYYQ